MTDGTILKDRIADFMAAMSKQVPSEVVESLSGELQKLADAGIAARALGDGARAPDFSLPNAQGGTLTLSRQLASGAVVVTFYRGSWCPFCDLQLRAYQEILPEIRQLGADVVAISPQTPDYAAADIDQKQLTFPVLTDAHNHVAREFGLVFTLSDTMKKLQEGFDNPIPKFNGDDSWELPIPGTFVVDRDRTIRLAHVDPNYMRRLEPAAILDALRRLRRDA